MNDRQILFEFLFAVIPVIKDKPKIIKIIKKRTVIIECVVVSKFEPKCTWFKETNEVKESERHKVDIQQVKDGEFAVKLEISEITDIDKGSYKMIAKNEKGEAISQVVELIDIPEEERKVVKPQIVKQLRNQNIHEGSALELIAAIKESDKKAKVVWYKNATIITEKSAREINTSWDGTTAKLSVSRTTTQHTASYRVVISNEAGGDESTSKVEVKKREEKKKEEEEEQVEEEEEEETKTDEQKKKKVDKKKVNCCVVAYSLSEIVVHVNILCNLSLIFVLISKYSAIGHTHNLCGVFRRKKRKRLSPKKKKLKSKSQYRYSVLCQ